MSKRLFIDLTKCDGCEECTVQCEYFYQPEATEHGILALRELATFAVVCRRCEEPNCAAACRFEALERQKEGMMKRYNMRCVSCKSCAHACPFGTIYPELVPFYTATCDYCLQGDEDEPACIVKCEKDALSFREVEESADEEIYVLSEHLAVHAPKWDKEDV